MVLMKLARSRRFASALIGTILLLVQEVAPGSPIGQIDPAHLVTIFGLLIGGYALQDAATALNPAPELVEVEDD